MGLLAISLVLSHIIQNTNYANYISVSFTESKRYRYFMSYRVKHIKKVSKYKLIVITNQESIQQKNFENSQKLNVYGFTL